MSEEKIGSRLRQLEINSKAPAMRALLERWVEYFKSHQLHRRMTVTEFAKLKERYEKLLDDTKTLLGEAKDADVQPR